MISVTKIKDRNGHEQLKIENAIILRMPFRNLEGRPTEYDKIGGKRSFSILIEDPALADAMIADGWSVKPLRSIDPDEPPRFHLKILIGNRIPPIFLHSGNATVGVDGRTINDIDRADIIYADLVVNPYHWKSPTGSGLSAYLNLMHVVLADDPFAHKYSNPNADELPFD